MSSQFQQAVIMSLLEGLYQLKISRFRDDFINTTFLQIQLMPVLAVLWISQTYLGHYLKINLNNSNSLEFFIILKVGGD